MIAEVAKEIKALPLDARRYAHCVGKIFDCDPKYRIFPEQYIKLNPIAKIVGIERIEAYTSRIPNIS